MWKNLPEGGSPSTFGFIHSSFFVSRTNKSLKTTSLLSIWPFPPCMTKNCCILIMIWPCLGVGASPLIKFVKCSHFIFLSNFCTFIRHVSLKFTYGRLVCFCIPPKTYIYPRTIFAVCANLGSGRAAFSIVLILFQIKVYRSSA